MEIVLETHDVPGAPVIGSGGYARISVSNPGSWKPFGSFDDGSTISRGLLQFHNPADYGRDYYEDSCFVCGSPDYYTPEYTRSDHIREHHFEKPAVIRITSPYNPAIEALIYGRAYYETVYPNPDSYYDGDA